MSRISVDGDRLWRRLMDLARIGATPAGGCNRQALTDADAEGRKLFLEWCESASLNIRRDAIGNLFARRDGTEAQLPPVMIGSHLDTQPTGGKFDGAYGCVASLEVIATMVEQKMATRHPVEVVVWTNEEGSRFDFAMMGSAVWAGNLELERAYGLADRFGRTVHDELMRTGQLGASLARAFPVKAALELHIEQGPLLEAGGLSIGVVTGVQHMCRYRLRLRGTEAHAGTTPMEMRRDPVRGLAELLPRLYAIAEAHGPDGRLTFGVVQAFPGSPNTIPGTLEMTADIRHPDDECYMAMIDGLIEECIEVGSMTGIEIEYTLLWESQGLSFDPLCIEAVDRAASASGYSSRRMISGAGHDACNLASVAPTGMIFVPCAGGLSHNEAESIEPDQAEAGANVLLSAVCDLAEIVT